MSPKRRVVRGFALGPLALDCAKLGFDRSDDSLSDLVLQSEDVIKLTVVEFGPYVIACAGIDELSSNSNLVSRLAHAAFNHVAHT